MIVNKYKNGGGSGSGYTLPIASASILGGIKVGNGLSIDGDGVLSASGAAGGASDRIVPEGALPTNVEWIPFQTDETPANLVKIEIVNDGTYFGHYNSHNNYVDATIENGHFNGGSQYCDGWTGPDASGVYTYNGGSYITCWEKDGYLYFKNDDYKFEWLDAYGNGGAQYAAILSVSAVDNTVITSTDGVYVISSGLPYEIIDERSDRLVPESTQNYKVLGTHGYSTIPTWLAQSDVVNDVIRYSGAENGKFLTKGNYGIEYKDVHFNPVSALPISCTDGEVFALASGSTYGVYQAQGQSQNTTWIVPDDNSKGWAVARFPIDGQDCHIAFNMLGITEGGVVWNSDNSGEWSSGDYQFTSESGSFTYTGEGWSMTGSTDGSYAYLSFSEGVQRTYWIENAEIQIYLPNYVQIGSGSGGGDYIHLDALTSGETGKTYEYEGRLMMWNPNSGNTAEWLKSIETLSDKEGTGLIYADIPNGQTLFKYKYIYGSVLREVVFSGDTLYCLETGGTVVCAVTIGNTFEFHTSQNGSSNEILGVYKDGYIGFKRIGSVNFENVWDGSVSGGHYELIDAVNYPYSEANNGIPMWNEKGQIVGKKLAADAKYIYVNNTGSSHSLRVLKSEESSFPDRFWVPTTGGSQGQILTSAGNNAAPVWATMIKSLKITSDAYEALVQAGTTDPNTLYLIVDE